MVKKAAGTRPSAKYRSWSEPLNAVPADSLGLLLRRQEARLALVHEQGSVTSRFDATFGDGAFWIADQTNAKFGTQASYLAGFFHVCEYLAAASKTSAPDAPQVWTETQKSLLKNNEFAVVIGC